MKQEPTVADVISKPLACRECGVEIVRKVPRGRPPSLCSACAPLARRRALKRYDARVQQGIPAATHYTCLDCEQTFPRPHGNTMPQRCRPCWTERERQRGVARNDALFSGLREKFETEGRWKTCETCGVEVRCAFQKGKAPRWCEPCRVERWNAKRKAMRPWVRPGACEDCGGKSAANRRRCKECNLRRRGGHNGPYVRSWPQAPEGELPYGPSWVRRRGGDDPFNALDIFERDKWICGICRKKIDRKLRHPDRMAATLDHIIPVIEGGLDTRPNVRPAHQRCNSSRNNRGGGEQLALLG